jgi:hypothetical protein
VKNITFKDMIRCSPEDIQRYFRDLYCPHIQGERISQGKCRTLLTVCLILRP